MRIKSLLVTLGILGTSSLALADHDYTRGSWDRDSRYQAARVVVREQPRVRDYGFRDDLRYRQRTTWLALTSPQRLDRGSDVFDLRHTDGRFAQLRLQNQTGRMVVRRIEIVFGNGERQRVNVNQVLEGNHAMVNIDLDGRGRRIDRILIDGRAGRGSSYQLYAM